jgi:hypothetical protein
VAEPTKKTGWWRVVCAAALLALGAGCGSDTVTYNYDCCLSNVWYSCTSAQSYGRCLTRDPSGCTQRTGPCPPGANQ